MEQNITPGRMFNIQDFKKGLIVVLENAYLEVAKIGTEYKLLNSDEHVSFLTKKKRDPSEARPDIAHQCLMTLLDSPLSKAGLLKIYVHTATNQVIDVNPKLRIPRTFKRFSGLMVQLLHKLSIKAEGVRGEPVLKLVKGPVTRYFPHNATVIGTSYSSSKLVDVFDFVPKLYEAKQEGEDEDEDVKEPNLKKIKVEQHEEGEEEKEKEKEGKKETKSSGFKVESDDEEEEKEKSESDSEDEEEEEDEEDVKEEQVDDIPQNFAVKESFNFTNGSTKEDKIIVFVVGAMSHGKIAIDYTKEEISISQYPLSGSVACGKICSAFERVYGIV